MQARKCKCTHGQARAQTKNCSIIFIGCGLRGVVLSLIKVKTIGASRVKFHSGTRSGSILKSLICALSHRFRIQDGTWPKAIQLPVRHPGLLNRCANKEREREREGWGGDERECLDPELWPHPVIIEPFYCPVSVYWVHKSGYSICTRIN